MTVPYNHVHDLNGSKGMGLKQSDIKYSATLTSGGGNTQLTVPASGGLGAPRSGSTNRWAIKIVTEQNTSVWFSVNATAAVPAGATFASVTSELIPAAIEVIREVNAGDVLNFITADTTADVSVTFYTLV